MHVQAEGAAVDLRRPDKDKVIDLRLEERGECCAEFRRGVIALASIKDIYYPYGLKISLISGQASVSRLRWQHKPYVETYGRVLGWTLYRR
jgi:hypothetical protein